MARHAGDCGTRGARASQVVSSFVCLVLFLCVCVMIFGMPFWHFRGNGRSAQETDVAVFTAARGGGAVRQGEAAPRRKPADFFPPTIPRVRLPVVVVSCVVTGCIKLH